MLDDKPRLWLRLVGWLGLVLLDGCPPRSKVLVSLVELKVTES